MHLFKPLVVPDIVRAGVSIVTHLVGLALGTSMEQTAEQPSLASLFPSSHSSPHSVSVLESPQVAGVPAARTRLRNSQSRHTGPRYRILRSSHSSSESGCERRIRRHRHRLYSCPHRRTGSELPCCILGCRIARLNPVASISVVAILECTRHAYTIETAIAFCTQFSVFTERSVVGKLTGLLCAA